MMDPDPFAPDVRCDACGSPGTVVRTRRSDVPTAPERRYCAACWPAQRAEQVRLAVHDAALFSIVRRDPALTWDRLAALAAAVERILPEGLDDGAWRRGPWRGPLNSVATELYYDALRLAGPMPAPVEEFIRRSVRGDLTNR